jgi:hypothetical protein
MPRAGERMPFELSWREQLGLNAKQELPRPFSAPAQSAQPTAPSQQASQAQTTPPRQS